MFVFEAVESIVCLMTRSKAKAGSDAAAFLVAQGRCAVAGFMEVLTLRVG